MFNKRHIVRTIAATVSILALSFTAACGSGQSTASNSTDSDDITQQTYKPGKLTIATGQPAYEPWVMNDKPESGEGYEAAVAYAVADKLGFKKSDVVWTRTAFDTAIAPGAKDWDSTSSSSASPTSARRPLTSRPATTTTASPSWSRKTASSPTPPRYPI